MRLVIAILALASVAADCPESAGADVTRLLREGHTIDAHQLAVTLDAICPDALGRPGWQLADAVALVRLEESQRARDRLGSLMLSSDPDLAHRAAAVLAWSFLKDGDRGAFRASLERLTPEARARLVALSHADDTGDFRRVLPALPVSDQQQVRALQSRLVSTRQKSPALAGTLSAFIPGLGQIYAGSWEGGAVAFLLNGVLITATVELAREDLYFTAAATGVVASVFYIGNIANAADLADRRNEIAQEPAREALERTLAPEAYP